MCIVSTTSPTTTTTTTTTPTAVYKRTHKYNIIIMVIVYGLFFSLIDDLQSHNVEHTLDYYIH